MIRLDSIFGEEIYDIWGKDFFLLMLAAASVPLGTGLISPILETLIGPFGATEVNVGLIISVFLLPAVFVIPIAGVLADRYGRKPVLVVSLVVFGLPGTAIAFTTDFRTVLVMRFLQGVGWCGLAPLTVTCLGDLFDGVQETAAQGLRQTGTSLAGGLVSVVAGVVVVVAWYLPFLVHVVVLLVAVAIYLWLDEPARDPEQRGEGLGVGDRAELSFRRLATERRVIFIVVARTLPLVVWIGFTTYNSIIVTRSMGGTPVQAGFLFFVGSLAMAVAASQLGRAVGVFNGRYALLVAANVCLGAGLVVFGNSPNMLYGAIGASAIGIGFGVTLPLYRSIITGFTPRPLRASVVSVGSMGARLMGMLTPIAMGGAIAYLTPGIGSPSAIQTTTTGVGVVVSVVSIGCVLLAKASPPVQVSR